MSRPTKRSASACSRLMFVSEKMKVAIIGNAVNRRNPMSHGAMNR